MFEIINWIIFGLFTTALIAYSAYALNCLLKTKTDFLGMYLVLFFTMNVICLSAITLLSTHVKPEQLNLTTLLGTFILDTIILSMAIVAYHDDIVSDYNWQQNQHKDYIKQKTIKL